MPQKTQKVLWFAFVGAIVIYNLIAFAIHASGTVFEIDFAVPRIFFYGMLFLAFGDLVVIYRLSAPLRESALPITPQKQQALFVISLALAEAIAILGLVFFFLGGEINIMWLLSALSLIGMALAFPKKLNTSP